MESEKVAALVQENMKAIFAYALSRVANREDAVNVISLIAEKHNVSRICLFGAYARGEASEKHECRFIPGAQPLSFLLSD